IHRPLRKTRKILRILRITPQPRPRTAATPPALLGASARRDPRTRSRSPPRDPSRCWRPAPLSARRRRPRARHSAPPCLPRPPPPVSQLGRALRRSDEIRNQDGRQNAVGLRHVPDAGKELLDLIQEAVGIADELQVIHPR